MRAMIVFVVWLGACASAQPQPQPKPQPRVPGGARAPVASTVDLLEALRAGEGGAHLLAHGVFEQCGQACACLDFSEPGDVEARFAMCRDVWADQPAADAGPAWRAIYIAGAYFADQHAAANADDRKALEAAMAALTMPLVPTLPSLGVAPPGAAEVAGYGGGSHLLTIDAGGAVRGGLGPIARFTPTGAVLAPAELKPLADAAAIAAFVRGLPASPPPAAEAPPDEPPGDGSSGRMGPRPTPPIAGAVTDAKHHATGTAGRVAPETLVIVADGGAPGAKLAEVMALAPQSAIAVAHRSELWVIPLVFRGMTGGAPDDRGNSAASAELAIEVVSVRDEDRVAQVVAAIDAAVAAGARSVRVETWYERKPGFGFSRVDPPGPGAAPADAPAAAGVLDKEIIRRYIKRNVPRIRHCYEKVLVGKPGLAGTVTAKFVILPTGRVGSSSAAGVDPAVADCVAAVIRDIKFPRPEGGSVNVSYPFTFDTAE